MSDAQKSHFTPERYYGWDSSSLGEVLCELTVLEDGTYLVNFVWVDQR